MALESRDITIYRDPSYRTADVPDGALDERRVEKVGGPMMTKTITTVAAVLVAVHGLAPAAAQSPRPSPIFKLESDEFWLNLHHFLYVLGRAEATMADDRG
jgi:hypothetical protein